MEPPTYEQLRAQYRGMPLPTYTWRARYDDWELIDFNDAAITFTNGTISDYLGVTASELFHHEPEILDDFMRCARGGGPIRREMRHRLGTSGETKEIVSHYAFIPPDLVVIHTEDVTERRQAEEAREVALLQEREARLRAETAEETLSTIVERVPLGIIVVNRAGYPILINQMGRSISGIEPLSDVPMAEQASFFTMREPRTGRAIEPEETAIALALQGQTVGHSEYTFRQPKGGSEVWVKAMAAPLHDDSGAVTGAVAVFEDITRERAVEQQRDDFLSAAAHDLKTPLTSIKGFTQLLQRKLIRAGTLEGAEAERYLERIDTTVGRMTSQLIDLLDTARLQMGESLALMREPLDLTALVRDIVLTTSQTAEHRHIELACEVDCLWGEWDGPRLTRVLINLLENAIAYSPVGNPVRVEVGREGNWAIVRVCDRGIGIPAHDLPRVFDRFFRGSNVSGRYAGTGIGLYGAWCIAEQHGGTIEAESQEGEGATFTLRLPLTGTSHPDDAATSGHAS